MLAHTRLLYCLVLGIIEVTRNSIAYNVPFLVHSMYIFHTDITESQNHSLRCSVGKHIPCTSVDVIRYFANTEGTIDTPSMVLDSPVPSYLSSLEASQCSSTKFDM